MDSLNSFMTKSLPTYESLFKAEHSDNQALMLFENYLCYRALLDVLSLRTSRWEHLVKVLYHQVKDVLDEECLQWLRLVHLAVLVREAILFPNHSSLSDVLKCLKVNCVLFSSQEVHRELTDNLNRSLISYFLLLHNDKDKVLETCDMNGWRIQEVVSAFPYLSPLQRQVLMESYIPNSMLLKILTQLKSIMMELQPPALVGFFDDKCENEVQGAVITANQMSLEPKESTTVEMKAPFQNVSFFRLIRSAEECKICNTAVTTTIAMTTTIATNTASDDDDDGDNDNDDDDDDIGNDDSSDHKKTPFRKKYFLRQKIDGKAEAIATTTTTNTASDDDNDDGRNNTPLRKKYLLRGKIDEKDEEHCGEKRGTSKCGGVLPKKRPRNDGRSSDSDSDHSGRISSDDDLSEEYFALHKPRGVRHRWTSLEVKNLLDGVKKFGVGNWADIYLNYYFLPCRNNISLKDKWRNMVKNKEAPKEFL